MKKKIVLNLILCMLFICMCGAVNSFAEEHSHFACGKTSCTDASHTADVWVELPSEGGTLEGGNYYLSSSVKMATDIFVTGDMNLCLNGYTLTLAQYRIDVKNNSTLTICDCAGNGKIKKTGQTAIYLYSGNNSFDLYGGTLTSELDSTGVAHFIYSDGTGDIRIYGGSIVGATTGIRAGSVGTILVDGGTISGTSNYGIDIDCYSSAGNFEEIIVKSGTVSGGKTGILISDSYGTGKITVSGGKVTGTKDISYPRYLSDYCGIGIAKTNHPGCNVEISGGTVSGVGAGVYSAALGGTVTVSGGTVGVSEFPYSENGVRLDYGTSLIVKGGTIAGETAVELGTTSGRVNVSMTSGTIYGYLRGISSLGEGMMYLQGGYIVTMASINYTTGVGAVSCSGGTVNVMGTNISSEGYCLSAHGNASVNVASGNLTSERGYALEFFGTGTVKISGGTFAGKIADVYLKKECSNIENAPLSLQNYSGDTLTIESRYVNNNPYIAKNVSGRDLITITNDGYHAYYEPDTSNVKIMKNHTFGAWVAEIPADCENDGVKGHRTCSECGRNYDEDGYEIDDLTIKAGHDFNILIEKIPETCTEDGVKAHKPCKVCGKLFDEYGEELTDITIKACHKFGEWVDEIPPTKTSDGVKGHKVCTACDKFFDANDAELTGLVIESYKALLNKIEVSGDSSAVVGVSGVSQSVFLATDKDAEMVCVTLRYPDFMTLNSINAKDFVNVDKNSESTKDGYTILEIYAQYSERSLIPKNTIFTPFEVLFDVAKTATPGEVTIEITENTVLLGNEMYSFEERISSTLQILPKLAERIEIIGDDIIKTETKYVADVYPDYTTNKDVFWYVSDSYMASVSQDGVVSPCGIGTFDLIALATDGSEVLATKTITIIQGIGFIDISGDDVIYGPAEYIATVWPENAADKEVEWSISDTNVATIDQNGNVTPVYGGKATITVTAKDGSGVYAVKEIEVVILAESVQISGPDRIYEPAQYVATIFPEYATDKNVIWSVSSPRYATVDENGVVTPKRSGTVVLTARTDDCSEVYGEKTIEIVTLAESITISGNEVIYKPTKYSASVTPGYTTNQNVKWYVSDESIATVDENGTVTPVKNGQVVLTAKAEDEGGVESSVVITVYTAVISKSIETGVGTWNKSFDPGITEYIVYVLEDTTSVNFKVDRESASVKINGTTVPSLVGRTVTLSARESVFLIELTPYDDDVASNTYTVTVIRGAAIETEISEDKTEITVKHYNTESDNLVILALYDGNKLVYTDKKTCEESSLQFPVDVSYTRAKVMLWENAENINPLCAPEIVEER